MGVPPRNQFTNQHESTKSTQSKQDEPRRVLRQPASGHWVQRRSAASAPRPRPPRRYIPRVPDRLHGGRQRQAHRQHQTEGPMVRVAEAKFLARPQTADQRREDTPEMETKEGGSLSEGALLPPSSSSSSSLSAAMRRRLRALVGSSASLSLILVVVVK